jgi:hypothetical protein
VHVVHSEQQHEDSFIFFPQPNQSVHYGNGRQESIVKPATVTGVHNNTPHEAVMDLMDVTSLPPPRRHRSFSFIVLLASLKPAASPLNQDDAMFSDSLYKVPYVLMM